MTRARPRIALLALAVLLAAAPDAAAHKEDAVNHFTVTVNDLEPGASREIHATYEGGPLREDWVMLLVGGVIGNATPLRITLSLHNETVEEWTWESAPGAINMETLALPQTSEEYVITLTNAGDSPLKFFFYFDQSCDCAAKPMPFPGSWAVFNFDYYAGEKVYYRFTTAGNQTLDGIDIRYTVAYRDGDGGVWPHDFETVATYPEEALPNGTITWDVPEDRTYYVMVQSTEGEGMIQPRLYVDTSGVDNGSKKTPAPAGLAAVAGALAAAIGLAVRRRGR